MKENFRFRNLTLIAFCLYIFWGIFGVDITLNPDAERIPLHRLFILLTAFIFIFNAQRALVICLKNKILITLVLYVLFSSLWVLNPSTTFKNFIFLSSTMLISMMTALAFSDNKLTLIRWLFWLFLLITLASIITAFSFPQIGINVVDFGKPRWIGITSHPNVLGAQALILTWLSSNLFFLSSSKLEKIPILLAIIAAFFTIIQADSITSLITSIIITTYTCSYYLFNKLSLPIKLTLFALSLLTFLWIVVFYMSATDLTTTTLESTGRNLTFTGRSLLWEKALKSVTNNIIIGYGFDDLEQLTKMHHILMSHLHNGYIETLVKGGIIASLLLAFILLKTIFHLLRIKPTYKSDYIFLNTGLIMILLHNFTESSILKGINPLSIFLFFIIASTSLITSNKYKASTTGH